MLGPLSLLPAAVAIALALWTRRVVVSLLAGVLTATLILAGGNPWAALVQVVDPLIIDSIADRGHVKITAFALLIAASVEVIGRAGGTTALVDLLTRRARGRRGGMTATWLAGLVVFFDDYANCLVVGNAMRGLTDRLRISREKLAYLVDSTAAPMASVALLSTWIGYEVSLMGDAIVASGRHDEPYAFFLEGLGYRSYPLLALFFAGAVAISGRDFGPMRQAEARLLAGDAPEPPTPQPAWKAWLAAVPIAALVAVTAGSLWLQGTRALAARGALEHARLFEIIGASDSYDAMLRGSIAAITLALGLALLTRSLSPRAASGAVSRGLSALLEPLAVLVLAWALASAMQRLGAADWLVGAVGDWLPAWSLPTVIFVLAAAISFATGTSFGTMGVLMPLALPLAFGLSPEARAIPLAAAAAVLSGSVWGDHCSPISDTTVLSSTGAGCEHAAHVRTQLPYALVVGVIAIVAGTLPAGFGAPAWTSLVAGAALCLGALWVLGRLPERETTT